MACDSPETTYWRLPDGSIQVRTECVPNQPEGSVPATKADYDSLIAKGEASLAATKAAEQAELAEAHDQLVTLGISAKVAARLIGIR